MHTADRYDARMGRLVMPRDGVDHPALFLARYPVSTRFRLEVTMSESLMPLQYVVNAAGDRTHVLLTVEQYVALTARRAPPEVGVEDIAQRPSDVSTTGAVVPAVPRPTDIPNLEPAASEEVFSVFLPRKGGHARAVWRYPTMVVLQRSTIGEPATATMPEPYRLLRQRLIDWGVISRIDGAWTFTRDYPFNNASEAVCVVEGGSRDGYRSWKNDAGKTLSDLGYSR